MQPQPVGGAIRPRSDSPGCCRWALSQKTPMTHERSEGATEFKHETHFSLCCAVRMACEKPELPCVTQLLPCTATTPKLSGEADGCRHSTKKPNSNFTY